MAALTHYLQYKISLTNKGIYDNAVENFTVPTLNPDGSPAGRYMIGMAPTHAEINFGATIVMPGDTSDPPSITSPFFGTEANYPLDQGEFTRKSGGWFGIPGLFPETHTYIWAAQFEYVGDAAGTSPITGETQTAMAIRTWVDGFENGAASASPTGNAYDNFSPLASRHPGGYGFACRRGSTLSVVHRHTESGHAATDRGWERFYIRLRHAPQTTQIVWQVGGTVSAGQGPGLRITVGAQLEAVNIGASTSSISTFQLELDRWYKVDVLYRMAAAPNGFFRAYVGGVQFAGITAGDVPPGAGISLTQNHNTSTLRDGDGTAHNGAWDLDDWIGAELPTPGSAAFIFPAVDWNRGSKVVPLRGQQRAASFTGNWAGPAGANANDHRFLTQRPVISTLVQGLSSAAASQRAALVTDAGRAIDEDAANRGIAAISVGVTSTKTSGPNDSTVSSKLPGAAEQTQVIAIAENTVIASSGRGMLTEDGGFMDPVTPTLGTEISYTSNSTANNKALYNLIGQAECIGNFYVEDYVAQPGDPASLADSQPDHWPANDLHQWPFGDGPWAPFGIAPPSIVVTHCGTYVGNGTSQQIAFRTPPTWIVIRNTATHELSTWMVSSPSGRTSFHEATRSSSFPRVYIDPNFTPAAEDDQSSQTLVTIAGNNVAINSNAVTYQFMAFQDAGQRFVEAGAVYDDCQVAAGEKTTPLNNASFTPEFLLAIRENVGNAITRHAFVKGLGLATQQINTMNGASLAAAFEMREGELAIPTGSPLLQNTMLQLTFMAFRRNDGSGDAGIPNVMQLASWTGDGTASRTITLGPATGRRPMWAFVLGSNGTARIRDATHTGTTSVNAANDTNDATTGITGGGIDSVSVGSVLNTAGVLYEMIVFPGCDATAGNAGWGVNCESIPVGPVSPVPPFLPPPGTPPPGPTPPPTTGVPTIPPTGTITQCPGPAALVINMALGKIGILKQVDATTLNTDTGVEITAARLHFDEDCKRILRDFPWPFATRYELLTQVAGPADEADLVQGYSNLAYYLVNSVVRVAGVDYYCITAHGGSLAAAHAVTDPAYWSTEPPTETNGDWVYAYRAPSLSLFNRRIVNNDKKTRRNWDMDPPDFRVGSDNNGALIYCDVVNAELEYTILDGCVPNQGDALFREALTWRHACSIAPALTRSKDIAQMCWEMYQRLLRDARQSGAQETQQAPQGDPDWITGRN